MATKNEHRSIIKTLRIRDIYVVNLPIEMQLISQWNGKIDNCWSALEYTIYIEIHLGYTQHKCVYI